MSFETQTFDLVRALLGCAGYLFVGTAIWLACEPRKRLPVSLCFPLGCAAMMLVMTLAAAIGLPLGFGWSLLQLVAGLAATSFLVRKRGMPRLMHARLWWPEYLFAAAVILALVIALPVLARPHLNYDVLSYHLPLSHELREGNLAIIAGNYYSRLPQGAFVLYAPLLSNRATTIDDPGIRLLLLCAMFAAAFLCGRIAGHLGARKLGQYTAVALYLFHPMVWNSYFNAHNDLLTALFALAAFERMLATPAPRKNTIWMFWSGLLAGSAVAVKFSAVGIVLAPLLFAAAANLVRTRQFTKDKRLLVPFLVLPLGMLVGYGPWLLRSLFLGGHPLHPFVGEAPGWTNEQARFLLDQHQPLSVFSAVYWQRFIEQLGLFGHAIRGTAISLVLVLAIAVSVARRRSAAPFIILAAIAGYAAWLTVGLAPARFALPAVALACAVAGCFFGVRFLARDALRRSIKVLAALLIVLAFVGTGPLRQGIIQPIQIAGTYMLGFLPDAWQRDPVLEELILATHDYAPEGNVLLMFEARSRLLPEGSRASTVWDVPLWADELKRSATANEFEAALRQKGYDHIVANEWELGRLIDFYGDIDLTGEWGTVGARMNEQAYVAILSRWPPAHFASFTETDLRVLREFLLLSQDHTLKMLSAGPVARMWLSPLGPENERASEQNGGETESK